MHASLLSTAVAALPAATGSTGSTKGGSSFVPFLILIVLFFIAYLIFIRPARNRQRAAVEARRKISPGDEIITTSGLIATVVDANDDELTLEIAPGVRARYVPAAVLRVLGDEPPDEPTNDVTNHEVIEVPEEPTDPPAEGSSGT